MPQPPGRSLGTRPSLLKRLQSGDQPESWREFYEIYGGLIRSFAGRAGLTPEEAEDVLQETAIGVARRLPEFVYDPKVCGFKTWLLNQTRWQIRKQRERRAQSGQAGYSTAVSDGTTGTGSVARLPDPSTLELGDELDEAWEHQLLAKGLERVRERIEERQFQIFDLYVTKAWPPRRVAQTLGVSLARVYLTKHRVAAMVKQEVQRLQKAADQALRKPD